MQRLSALPLAISAILMALLAVAPATTRASVLEENLARLTVKVAEEVRPGPTPSPMSYPWQLASFLASLESAVDRQFWSDALAQLGYFDTGLKNQSPWEIMQLVRELRPEVQDRIDRARAAEIARLAQAAENAVEFALGATEVTALDPVFRELTPLQGETTYHPPDLRASYEQLKATLAMVAHLQAALLLEAAGKPAEAAARLDELLKKGGSQVPGRPDLIARAERLREQATAQAAAAAAQQFAMRVTSLDELDETAGTLSRQLSAPPEDKRLRDYHRKVILLRQSRDALRAAHYGYAAHAALTFQAGDTPAPEELLELQQQILADLLPHYVQSNTPITRQAGEPISDVLLRLLRDETEKQDWRAALRVLETLQLFSFSRSTAPEWLACDLRGFAAITVAAEQEKSGFRDEAEVRYQAALGCAGQHLPVDWIRERVKTLSLQRAGKQSRPASSRKPR